MASVALDFVQPVEPDVAALRIYEGLTVDGQFQEIERVIDIGTYPNYISRYTTAQAVNAIDWFAIAWENVGGVVGPLSQPVRGNVDNYVAQLTERILLRDPTIPEAIALETAEAIIETIAGGNPYTTDITLTRTQLTGCTYLALAMIYCQQIATSSVSVATGGGDGDYTAGIVSQKSGSSSSSSSKSDPSKAIECLLEDAANMLAGLPLGNLMLVPVSVVAQMKGVPCVTIGGELWEIDQSRLLMIEKI